MNGVEHATPGIAILLLVIAFLFWRTFKKVSAGGEIFVRRIPGVDAIDEAIGRSAELGRPTIFSTGITAVGPTLYACLGVLSYVAQRIARFKSKIIVPQNAPDAMAVVESTMRESYRVAGRSANYDPTSVVFLSEEQFAYASGYMGIVHREKAASTFLFGAFAAESLIMSEAGQQVGAMQVAASVSPEQTAFFICTCDYTLIGEELFASAAYLTRDYIQLASLRVQDITKLLFFFIVICGVLIATWNVLYPASGIPNIDSIISTPWWFFGAESGQ